MDGRRGERRLGSLKNHSHGAKLRSQPTLRLVARRTEGRTNVISLGQLLINRLERAGANVPEYNLASDLMAMAATRADELVDQGQAMRIPDLLGKAAIVLRNRGRELGA